MTVANGQLERKQGARQTRQKVIARFETGYWGTNAPLGYKMQTDSNKPRILIRDEPIATYIQHVLEGFANGRFETLVEAKRYLDSCPEFPKTKSKGVHTDVVKKLLTRTVYAGMVEMACWGISLREGHHEGLVDIQTFKKIQDRLEGKSKAPQRKDLNLDFPLRGAVNCGCCDGALTANWSKGRKARHPYYICRNKGCESYGKSIRRDVMHEQFGELLEGMVAPKPVIKTADTMFRLHWDDIDNRKAQDRLNAESELLDLEIEKERIIDKIINVNNLEVTRTLEDRLQKMELDKLALQEKISKCGTQTGNYDKSFRTAMSFLENPHKLWASEQYEHKRAVIQLAFSERLVYDRNQGFRTAAKAEPFRLIEELSMGNTKMVGRAGFEPATN
ncbi:recombinase [Alteromonadaceae bacterium M269]|nr:recombinase [Alteromonadaceae bacterium M269]